MMDRQQEGDESVERERRLLTGHAAELHEVAVRRLALDRSRLLKGWLDGGGTEAEFAESWPAIRAQLSQMRLMEVGDTARNRSLASLRKLP